ncbi:hypothetical protein CKA32_004683 [Geitlerinema sp. FC II]|nr:hypothetical protein CKA32_004683 [Geitlerinema sp. FC II]
MGHGKNRSKAFGISSPRLYTRDLVDVSSSYWTSARPSSNVSLKTV